MIRPGIDLRIEELVGPLDDLPCEDTKHGPGPGRPATHYLVYTCCGASAVAVCSPCRERIIRTWSGWSAIQCVACKVIVQPGTDWPRLRRFEPIPKGHQ